MERTLRLIRIIHKTGNTEHISQSRQKDWATTTGNIYKTFRKIRAFGMEILTDRWSQYFAPMPGGEAVR